MHHFLSRLSSQPKYLLVPLSSPFLLSLHSSIHFLLPLAPRSAWRLRPPAPPPAPGSSGPSRALGPRRLRLRCLGRPACSAPLPARAPTLVPVLLGWPSRLPWLGCARAPSAPLSLSRLCPGAALGSAFGRRRRLCRAARLGPATALDARMVKTGFDPATYRLNLHLHSLISSGRLTYARALFDQMPHKNAFSLNRMLSGYSRSGDLSAAESLFRAAPHRDAVTWTVMMSTLTAAGRGSDAFSLFRDMLREGVTPDRVTVSTVLNVPGCGTTSLHPFAIKLGLHTNVVICNTLLDAYCKHGLLSAGRRVFQEMPERDSVTYNAMMMGCSKLGLHGEALDLFAAMRRAGLDTSRFTFSSMLTVATGMGDLHLGRQVHGLVVRATSAHNVFVSNSLLDFYSKCDCLGEMKKLFDEMPERDNVSYNVMIAGYAWNRCASTVLRLFREMQMLGFDRQALPYASLLSVAGSLPDIGIGKQIHAQLVLLGLTLEDLVGNALIDMYSKCGMLDAAKTNFVNKNDKTGISWTAMITGYVHLRNRGPPERPLLSD